MATVCQEKKRRKSHAVAVDSVKPRNDVQAARVRFPSRVTISEENVALFYNPASGGMKCTHSLRTYCEEVRENDNPSLRSVCMI
jgi:hypothetical protein